MLFIWPGYVVDLCDTDQLAACQACSLACRSGVSLRLQEVHKLNVRIAHIGEEKTVRVGEMVEHKAVELATSMMTETFIYSVRHHISHSVFCANALL
jgi:hypothetical protein